MEYTSLKDAGVNQGYNILDDHDYTEDNLRELFFTDIEIRKTLELLEIEKEYLGNFDYSHDYNLIGVSDLGNKEFNQSTFSKFMSTTYRFYDNDRFISSDWVLPIEIVKGVERYLVTDTLLINNGSIHDMCQELFGDVGLVKVYFSHESKTIVCVVE